MREVAIKLKTFHVADGKDTGPSKPGAITGTDADSHGVCGAGNYVYTINAVSDATSYAWKAPYGVTIISSNANGTSATLSASASFNSGSLTVSASNSCGVSPVQTKTLSETPEAPSSISGPLNVLKNKIGLTYNVSPAVSGLKYIWTVPFGAKITSGQNTSLITVTWGLLGGKVTAKAQNDCGYSEATTKDVGILKLLTGEEDGESTEYATAATSYSLNGSDLYSMPNPVKDLATVVFNADNAGSYVIRIRDLSGKQLMAKNIISIKGENRISADVHNYTNGLYIVTVENSKGFIKTTKLVKE